MKKQILRITAACIFFVILRLLSSCCEENIRQELILTGFTLHNMDNSLKKPTELPPTRDEVNREAYVIRVKLTTEYGEHIYSSIFYKMNTFSSVASATSCGAYYTFYYIQSPTEVLITSDVDFNEQYPAGSSLNDLFICLPGNSKGQGNYPSHAMSIDRVVNNMKGDVDSYYEYIDFYLKYPPENNGTYTFSVSFIMSDENTFTEQITVILK